MWDGRILQMFEPDRASDELVLKKLGSVIHDKRVAQGFSQEQLSKKTGISRYYISSIERGAKNVTIMILRRLASVLNLKSWELLQRAEE
jgi:transcriptional regulator with XRE-family HTH domain